MALSVRFVHCAGFRFDSRSWEGPVSWVNMRNQDLWQTFEAVLTLCRTEKADFLFLTGDLFELEYVSKKTVERVAKSFSRLDGTRIFIVPGQRDPLVTTSAYRLAEWPNNVHIFSEGLGQVEVPFRQVTVYGSGWTTYRQEGVFLDDFHVAQDDEHIDFMLLHAEVDCGQNIEGFIPLQVEQIESSGLTYLALGHRQKWSGLQKAGDTYWADCGSPEARSFQENWPHGVLLGETDGESTQIEFRELGQRRYIEKTLSLQTGNIEAIVAKLLAKTTPEERQKDLFRLKITKTSPKAEKSVQTLQKLLADKFCFLEILHSENENASHLGTTVTATDPMVESRQLGFPSLTQVFENEIQTRLTDVQNAEEQKHWELVRKIGSAALIQGREDDENTRQGQTLSFAEKRSIGEYVFGEGPGASQTGEHIIWPDRKEEDFFRLVTNLSQVGDEELSLTKTWDTLARAKKRIEEQTESMDQIKNEYNSLRLEWEAANRKQDEERLLQIEIKNLQAEKSHLTDSIASTTKIQERLAFFRQNQDYRELRTLHGELTRLEENRLQTEARLSEYTRDPQVDWVLIESIREECLEWARLQEEAERVTGEVQLLEQKMNEIQNFLQTSGYREFPEDKDQHLLQAEKERDTAQSELENLGVILTLLEDSENNCRKEIAKLEAFSLIAGITVDDEHRVIQAIERLAKWQNSKLSDSFDWFLREHLGWKSIRERLSSHLTRTLNKYHIVAYDEFKQQQKEYHHQQQIVRNLQTELESLHKKAGREKELRRIIQSRNQLLKQTYSKVNADDLMAWLSGWEDYRRKKSQVAEILDELHLKTEQQRREEETLTSYVNQLRGKLKNWSSPVSDTEEVLAIVMKVARQLRAKEEAIREYNVLEPTYTALLGKRKIEQLAKTLEPLADLEREARLSDEQRQGKLADFHQKLTETINQLANAEKSLQQNRTTPMIPDLEKKLEIAKQQWKAYEELQQALEGTKDLLETSLQKWQIRYGNALEEKVQKIFNRTFSSPASTKKIKIIAEAKRYYFAYRIGVAQIALADSPETPFFFFVEEMKEPQVFWEDVFAYLHELSLSRQIVFRTPDPKLQQLALLS